MVIIATEMWYELLRYPQHMIFEVINEVVFAIIGFVAARAWVKVHDRKNHGHKHCDDVHDDQGQLF
jgi:hypothetical protein